MDGVAVAQRLRQRLEHHRTDAFGIDEAVGVAAEGASLRPFRQHPESGEFQHVLRIEDQTDGNRRSRPRTWPLYGCPTPMDRGERREQALSTANEGPEKSNRNEIRLAIE